MRDECLSYWYHWGKLKYAVPMGLIWSQQSHVHADVGRVKSVTMNLKMSRCILKI